MQYAGVANRVCATAYFYGFAHPYKAALHAGFVVNGDMLENSLSLSWALIAAELTASPCTGHC